MTAPPKTANVTDLAKLIGIKRDHVYKHIERAGLKPKGRKYDVRAFILAVKKHRDEDNRKAPSTGPRAEKLRLESEILRHKLDRLEGTSLPADEVERAWADLVTAARAKLLSIPARLADQVRATKTRRQAEKLIRDEINLALEELANYDPSSNGSTKKRRRKASATAGTKPKPMGRRKSPTV